uniref:VOC family protein n=1 Tax=Pseudomonas laurentiana TaxID=2364649 RepID=UPI0029C64A63|nr:VOC family protein [Pseudomonas laurentiana]
MEVDHLFICVTNPTQSAAALSALGLIEGTPNAHPGQGTANRRFFLQNTFIELLYLTDAQEAQSPLTAPTQLSERLSRADSNASPFGVCFRPATVNEVLPFPCWEYRPAYLPASLKVDVGHAPAAEPMWFFLSFAKRPDQMPPERAQPIEHPNGFREITAVRVTTTSGSAFSAAASCANHLSEFEIIQGDEHLMELEIDHGFQGQTHDFRPSLPLVMNW